MPERAKGTPADRADGHENNSHIRPHRRGAVFISGYFASESARGACGIRRVTARSPGTPAGDPRCFVRDDNSFTSGRYREQRSLRATPIERLQKGGCAITVAELVSSSLLNGLTRLS
jgi:hypothetical protein